MQATLWLGVTRFPLSLLALPYARDSHPILPHKLASTVQSTVGHVDGHGRNYVGAKENVVNVLY